MAKKNKVINPYYGRSTVAVFNELADYAVKNLVEVCNTKGMRENLKGRYIFSCFSSGVANMEEYINGARSEFAENVRNSQVYNATSITEKLLSDFYEVNRAKTRGDKFFDVTNLGAKEHIKEFLNIQKNALTGEDYSESLWRYTLPNPNVYVELANTDDLYIGVLLTFTHAIGYTGYILTYQPEGIRHITYFKLSLDKSSDDELPKWEVRHITDPYLGNYTIENYETGEKATLMSLVVRPLTLVMEIFHRVNNTAKKHYNFYTEDTSERPHYINYKGGKCILPNRPTYIILDKDIKDVRKYARKSDSKIEYSFSWIVRGHYRRLHNPESFGKDMFNRKIQGKTWVESYTKGDQNLPLKNTNYKIKMA